MRRCLIARGLSTDGPIGINMWKGVCRVIDAKQVSERLHEVVTEEDDAKFLSDLRTFLVDPYLNLVALAHEVDDRTLGMLYLASILVNDVWVNLAIDASFEFPSDHPKLADLSKALRQFMVTVLEDGKEMQQQAFASFCRAVKDYYLFLYEMELKLRKAQW